MEISKERGVTDTREPGISSGKQDVGISQETKAVQHKQNGQGARHSKEYRVAQGDTKRLLPQKEGNGAGKKQGR